MFSRASAPFTLAVSVATSGGAGLLSWLLAVLGRPVDPALVRTRAVAATDAANIARASRFARSLPPELIAEDLNTDRPRV